jgi:hypothetical protein
MAFYDYEWKPYVPVAERRRKAMRAMEKHKKNGHAVSPVTVEGRTIARTFWGKAWCEEGYSDYANRLPRADLSAQRRGGRSANQAGQDQCLRLRLRVISGHVENRSGQKDALEIHLQGLRGRDRFAGGTAAR